MGRSDEELVEEFKQGSREALEELCGRHLEPLHTFVFHHYAGRNEAVAQDIVQETATVLVEKIASFKGQSKFRTWLYGIARNCGKRAIADAKRAQSSREYRLGSDSRKEMTPDEHGIQKEEVERMNRAIAGLPEKYSEVIELHYRAGLKDSDVAEVLGITHVAVRKRLSRARKQLHTILDAERLSGGRSMGGARADGG